MEKHLPKKLAEAEGGICFGEWLATNKLYFTVDLAKT